MDEVILNVENLNKSFGYKRIITNLSLSVKAGEICGFLGPNGSGKTTTIKMITGLLRPDSGKITICGYDVEKDFEKALENVSAIVENPDVFKNLTGKQNLNMVARVRDGVSKEQIDEAVKTVKLENRINDKVKRYSLGMKQRLGVAAASLGNAKLLIFDEPTNGLDPEGIKDFRDMVKRLAKEKGVAVFVSSHMMAEMQVLCDRVIIIEKGQVIGDKDVKAIVDGVESTKFKFVVSDGEKAKSVIANLLGEESIGNIDSHKLGDIDVCDITVSTEFTRIEEITKRLIDGECGFFGVQPVGGTLESAFIDATNGSKIQ